jgi:sulfate adenylyltransferase
MAFVASELARAGAAVIASTTAPHEAGRQAVRETITRQAGPGGNFFLIHVATPIEHCVKTDRRGVYVRARKGIIKGFVGVDEEFDPPKDPNLVVDITRQSIPEIVHSGWSLNIFNKNIFFTIHRHRIIARDDRTVVAGHEGLAVYHCGLPL